MKKSCSEWHLQLFYEIEGLIWSGNSLRLLMNDIKDDSMSLLGQTETDMVGSSCERESYVPRLTGTVNKWLLSNVKHIYAREKIYR